MNWKELLREVATDLGLDVNRETDLVTLAQYHLNSKRNRAKLNDRLLREFTKDAVLSENHRLIAALSIHTIWTTNYDTLLEDGFRQFDKRPDVKSSEPNLSQSVPNRDVTIYKMHGEVSQPHDAVLTKDDYERYSKTRGLFIEKLQGDLVSKTFLFLGFSFTDPNVDYILSRIRVILNQNVRQHYCIMKRPQRPPNAKSDRLAEFEYESRKHELRVDDLSRYGIGVIDIDDYKEIPVILKELNRRGHRRDVFVSGSSLTIFSHSGKIVLKHSRRRVCGTELIRRDYGSFVSGFGLGIGSAVLVVRTGSAARRRIAPAKKGEPYFVLFLKQRRPSTRRSIARTCFRNAGARSSFQGTNARYPEGRFQDADGVLEEFKIAKTLKKYPIPVGASGHAAGTIWNEVMANIRKFYPTPLKVETHLKTLGDRQVATRTYSTRSSRFCGQQRQPNSSCLRSLIDAILLAAMPIDVLSPASSRLHLTPGAGRASWSSASSNEAPATGNAAVSM